MRNEAQVILMPPQIPKTLDILGINAASIALIISDIRAGRRRSTHLLHQQRADRQSNHQGDGRFCVDLIVAGTKQAIAMVECGAIEVSEQVMVEALDLAHRAIQPIIEIQEQMAREVGKVKREVELTTLDQALVDQVKPAVVDRLLDILRQPYVKENLYNGIRDLKEAVIEELLLKSLRLYRNRTENPQK